MLDSYPLLLYMISQRLRSGEYSDIVSFVNLYSLKAAPSLASSDVWPLFKQRSIL